MANEYERAPGENYDNDPWWKSADSDDKVYVVYCVTKKNDKSEAETRIFSVAKKRDIAKSELDNLTVLTMVAAMELNGGKKPSKDDIKFSGETKRTLKTLNLTAEMFIAPMLIANNCISLVQDQAGRLDKESS